jgi:hypothetical protein
VTKENGTWLVFVTKADILAGERESGESCPVARAIRRSTGRRVFVGDEVDFFTTKWPEIKLPAWVVSRIRHYDQTGWMKPFRFALKSGIEVKNQ